MDYPSLWPLEVVVGPESKTTGQGGDGAAAEWWREGEVARLHPVSERGACPPPGRSEQVIGRVRVVVGDW